MARHTIYVVYVLVYMLKEGGKKVLKRENPPSSYYVKYISD